MLCINILKKIGSFLEQNKYTLGLLLSIFLYTTGAESAEMFEDLTNSGKAIFSGIQSLVYPAATIGIACVCIGGVFGNFNWKWLAAILIGVFIMLFASASGNAERGVDMFAGD